jgi:hypothetical protein
LNIVKPEQVSEANILKNEDVSVNQLLADESSFILNICKTCLKSETNRNKKTIKNNKFWILESDETVNIGMKKEIKVLKGVYGCDMRTIETF